MSNRCELLRSLEKDSVEEVETELTGTLPDWLEGCLVRVGPARFEFGNKICNHLLDGSACINKFKISNGMIHYSNKFLETDSFKKTSKDKRLYSTFGTSDELSNIFSRVKNLFKPSKKSDNTNINVLPYANEHLYALTETNYIHRIDPLDLKIIEKINITDYIPSARTSIGHPHVERDGTWYTVGINSKNNCYEFIKYYTKEKPSLDTKTTKINNICENGEVIASLPSSHRFSMNYFHSFGITENYIIFLEQALLLSVKSLVSGAILNRPMTNSVLTKPDQKTRIYIIDKNTGEISKKYFFTDPLISFHHINAFETFEPHFINIDICGYDPKCFEVNDFKYKKMFSDTFLYSNPMKPCAKRIQIPFGIDILTDEEIYCPIFDLQPDALFEMPAINYARFNGLPYQYIYGCNYNRKPFSIVKINLKKPMEIREWKYFENDNIEFLPSEPVFVERPNPTSEDDGILLVIVLEDKYDFLSILDAKSMVEIARAKLPDGIKAGFTLHGFFADRKNFKKMNF